jgi:post-segregation antitoxin (ccd killing protein)
MAKKSTRGGKREGAGRPVGEEGRAVTIVASVPETLVDGLDERAHAEGWNRSRAITEAIRALLKRKKR